MVDFERRKHRENIQVNWYPFWKREEQRTPSCGLVSILVKYTRVCRCHEEVGREGQRVSFIPAGKPSL
jgi:hypothetical protein